MAVGIVRSIWTYRGFISGSVKRDFQTRYRNSLLGAAWTILNPLAMIVVYTVIFAEVMKARLPGVDGRFAYSIFLCAGTLTWGLFAEIVGRAQNVFIEQANLIKKINFPRICLPVIVVVNAGINFGIIFGLFVLFLLFSGSFPGIGFLGIFPVLAIQVLFAIGLGMSVGVLNVFFRDVGQLFAVLLQFWFWFTPVVYPRTILPQWVQKYIDMNPMTPLIGAYQEVLVHGRWPDWNSLLLPAGLALALCFLGLRLFRKRVGEMVDEL
ncbi:ABC transporter permease [Noviherbaspirillum galbum]|uniref:Transport permease protein n=1 Tax=Noviherbaspirillum galbum TaxID=2709383 RepID=A0A6B3SVD4_9BURK|nr:ABC transporter permease [Noviherbaspirillum galbum]NEX64478.1 ABC transporter permease [Noviherbaspirillum galbum]